VCVAFDKIDQLIRDEHAIPGRTEYVHECMNDTAILSSMSVFLRSRSVREVINDTHMTNADEYNA
jgi:hypothetical protein